MKCISFFQCIFGRTSSQPLAILHEHEKSATAVDWIESAAVSGSLAAGAGNGMICIYVVFPCLLKTEQDFRTLLKGSLIYYYSEGDLVGTKKYGCYLPCHIK